MRDAKDLRELARWYREAARNASDPRVKEEMLARAAESARLADVLVRQRREDEVG